MAKKNRVALITGAAHGIGEGIAQRLARDGHAVVLVDINETRCAYVAKQLEASFGVETEAISADTSNEEQIGNALLRVRERFGALDALVNNAGDPDPSTAAIDLLERKVWDRYLEVNLTGYFLTAKHAMPMLRESRGAIVNISSVHAMQSDAHNNMAYAASKGGIIAFTHALAIAEGPKVRVNCISPGWIDVRPEQERKQSPLRHVDHDQHPVGRVGLPADIASLAAWLLSAEAGFVTGQNFVADGGMNRRMCYAN